VDSNATRSRIDQTYRLLALCARAEGHPAFHQQLRAKVAAFTGWDELPSQAETHGMSGLLLHHVQSAAVEIPRRTLATLTGLQLRQRALSAIHTKVLLETCSLLQRHGFRPLVLKGLALAYKYYPQPALRAISDIDLLVPESDMLAAAQALAAAEYEVRRLPEIVGQRVPEEITALAPPRDGIKVLVELHQRGQARPSWLGDPRQEELWGVDSSPQELRIGEDIVLVPAFMDGLRYLQLHLRRHLMESTAERPLPLKWIADIVSVVEHHASEIDWLRVRRTDRALLHRLSVCYSLTPLPATLAETIPIEPSDAPSGLNQYSKGWPGVTYRGRRLARLLGLAWYTFVRPSEWWLRLYNGIGKRGCWWYGTVVHPLQLLHLALRSLIRRTA
jgi:hypothetical protein